MSSVCQDGSRGVPGSVPRWREVGVSPTESQRSVVTCLGRQVLEGAELAFGNRNILDQLRQRPDVHREPFPELPRDTPSFNLDEKMFGRNVRSAEKGAAAGPSGMTCYHSRPLLDSNPDMHLSFVVGELCSRGQIPHDIVQLVKLGRMTALPEKDGGLRGIVAGEVTISCKNHRSTVEFSISRGHSSVPMRIDHACRVRVRFTRIASHLRVGRECHGDVN